MTKVVLVLLILAPCLLSMVVGAGAKEIERKVVMTIDSNPPQALEGSVFGVNQTVPAFYYGGTVWDASDGRWEAAEPSAAGWEAGKMWTWSPGGFAGIPHSGQNMDGWTSTDATTDSAQHFTVQSDATIGACVIDGNKSLFCGNTSEECYEECYRDLEGTGYGNNWSQMIVTGNGDYETGDLLTLSYDYANETEFEFDYTNVILQVVDDVTEEWVDAAVVATYHGLVSGTEVIDLAPVLFGLSTENVVWRILFEFDSDESWSDEDGLLGVACGACVFDNVVVSGSRVNWSEDFEAVDVGGLPAGWEVVTAGSGDFARAELLSAMPVSPDEDPCVVFVSGWCGMADSVIVFNDPESESYPHPLYQDNYVTSPVVDLSANPGLPVKHLIVERFASLAPNENVFMYWMVRYRPGCESGGWSSWVSDNYLYHTPEGVSCSQWTIDASYYAPPEAIELQMALGVVNHCATPYFVPCSFSCNATPYYDNVTFCVSGAADVPYLAMREYDYWQDQFAKDGTLSPASAADTRIGDYRPDYCVFGDTLVCSSVSSASCDAEVYFVFRMARKGPQQATAHVFFTDWFPGVEDGGWHEARMDTAEITDYIEASTNVVPGRWMCAFHESDPIAVTNGLPEGVEILPNDLLVPGTRVEYFLKTRCAGQSSWFYLPDTTGGCCEEFEILPGMTDDGAGGVEWPCLIVADHFGQNGNGSPVAERNADRIARHLNALGYGYDVYNKLAPSMNQGNGIARCTGNTGPGATLGQMTGYTHCMLNTGNVPRYCLSEPDVSLLTNWLVNTSSFETPRFLWLTGDQVVADLNGTPWGSQFLNNVLCATLVSSDYAAHNSDYTYCLPTTAVGDGRFYGTCPGEYVVRMNGCRGRYAVVGVSGSSGCGGVAEREYGAPGAGYYSAVSNAFSDFGGADYRTFVEGYDNCLIRSDATLGDPACGNDDFLTTWFNCVLTWAGYPGCDACNMDMVVGVSPNGPVPAARNWLGAAYPNPMNPVATIKFSVGASGRVVLSIFDVSGRVVRVLVDENRAVGEYNVMWDGKDHLGERVSSGVFFYQLEASGFRSSKKIVILR